jgi:hypothetical protein
MKREATLLALITIFFSISTTSAIAQSASLIPSQFPAKGPYDLGVIFNTNDLLLGLESYQAGLGAKIGWGNFSVRGLFDFTINGSSQSFGLDAAAAVEYHLIPGPISPYVGASIGGGYMTQNKVTSVVTFSFAALAGVEIFILDFLSVFAEYAVQADLTNTKDSQTSQNTFDYLISTGMGNSAKLGIVIYFMRSEANHK